jgi:hypothetical protein
MDNNFVLNTQHWIQENFRERCTRKQAQSVLLEHSTLIFKGRLYDMKVKHVGAGIYEIYKELHVS